MPDLALDPADLPPHLREWLAEFEPTAFSLAVERLADGRVLLRALPELDPRTVAELQVTIAKYHEALMNLS